MVWVHSEDSQGAGGGTTTVITATTDDGLHHTASKATPLDDGLYHPMKYAGTHTAIVLPNTYPPDSIAEISPATQARPSMTLLPATDIGTKDGNLRAPQENWTKVLNQHPFDPNTPKPMVLTPILPTTTTTKPPPFPSSTHHASMPPKATQHSETGAIKVPTPSKSNIGAAIGVLFVICLITTYILLWLHCQKKRRTMALLGQGSEHNLTDDYLGFFGVKPRKPSRVPVYLQAPTTATEKGQRDTPNPEYNCWATRNGHDPQIDRLSSKAKAFCYQSQKCLLSYISLGVASYRAFCHKIRSHSEGWAYARSHRSHSHGRWWKGGDRSRHLVVAHSQRNSTLSEGLPSTCPEMQSPSPAILLMQQAALTPMSLRSVSSGRAKRVDGLGTPNGSAAGTVSTISNPSTASLSETGESEEGVSQTYCPIQSTACLYRRDIYHVDIGFEPHSKGHMSLQEGESVIITQVLEDGWVHCQKVGSQQEGLVPRAFLSAWPMRRVVSPLNAGPKSETSGLLTPVSQDSTNSLAQSRFYKLNSGR
ncbi:hypothetical protein N7492_000003 [Penicillium capsulatum]|uniref:SH3 domain-containing protein n=1 Tax=Penicillium capsulatum TaxID=69766 RepID=A0A9W9IR07_9EURO|nr:hypothetical protein N7492_000003 [Penicillium capsulatum]KAJ6130924.1 hypothetical protein N7512_003704 [Penicillium capsulatum]